MVNWIKNKFKLIDNIIDDFLGDVKSLRYQLIIMAFIFNFYLFIHSASDIVMCAAIGLLTAVFAFFFASKSKQAEMENTIINTNTDPPVDRTPD